MTDRPWESDRVQKGYVRVYFVAPDGRSVERQDLQVHHPSEIRSTISSYINSMEDNFTWFDGLIAAKYDGQVVLPKQ